MRKALYFIGHASSVIIVITIFDWVWIKQTIALTILIALLFFQGGYAYDRESANGKFYCTQHFKLPPKESKFVPKRLQHKQRLAEYAAFKSQQNRPQSNQQPSRSSPNDVMDHRGKTPERIEFENADEGIIGEEVMDDQMIMDENEWTDLNFGTGDEDSMDDESTTDESDSDSDSEIFEDPIGVDAQTLQLASDWIDRRSTLHESEDEFYGYSSGDDDDGDSQTEGEELAKAREIRMNEVKLQPPPLCVLTDTETEVSYFSFYLPSSLNFWVELEKWKMD